MHARSITVSLKAGGTFLKSGGANGRGARGPQNISLSIFLAKAIFFPRKTPAFRELETWINLVESAVSSTRPSANGRRTRSSSSARSPA
jgi:hypothetical protein